MKLIRKANSNVNSPHEENIGPLICGSRPLFCYALSVEYMHTRKERSRKDGMCLTARERILMIRLMEKLEKHPTYTKTLGIEATGAVNNQNMESDPKGLTSA